MNKSKHSFARRNASTSPFRVWTPILGTRASSRCRTFIGSHRLSATMTRHGPERFLQEVSSRGLCLQQSRRQWWLGMMSNRLCQDGVMQEELVIHTDNMASSAGLRHEQDFQWQSRPATCEESCTGLVKRDESTRYVMWLADG